MKIPILGTTTEITMSCISEPADRQVHGFISLREEASSGDKEGAMLL